MVIRYSVLIFGLTFYVFSVSKLLGIIREENFSKSFLRLMDPNEDGIITKKEFSAFEPCELYNGKKIKRIFSEYGRRVDLGDFSLDLDEKIILNAIKECVGDVANFTNPDHLKNLKKSTIKKELLSTYDINHDGFITWGEYNIGNRTVKKQLPYARIVFKFFDKNHDWKISQKQLTKVKVAQLTDYISEGGKRKKSYVN